MNDRGSGGGRLALLAAILVTALAGFVAIASAYLTGGWTVEADESLAAWVVSAMPAAAEWGGRVLGWIGGAVGVTLVTVGAVAALWLRARPLDAALVGVSVVGVQLLVLGLKRAYERPRPSVGSPVDLPGSYSFPSGHAATGVALFGLLGLLAATSAASRVARVAWGAAGLAFGVAIGASRVVLNVHYASDVLAGYLVGLAWLAAVLLAREVAELRHAAGAAG